MRIRKIVACVPLVILSCALNAAPTAYEGFESSEFTNGSAVSGNGSGFGWSGNWTGDTQWKFQSAGLSDGTGNLPNTGGNMALTNIDVASLVRGLSSPVAPSSGNTSYFSFLLSNEAVTYAGGNQAVIVVYNSVSGNSNNELFKVGHLFGGTNWSFRPNANGSTTTIGGISGTDDTFFVVKVTWDLSTGGDERIDIFVDANPASGEPSPTVTIYENLREGGEVIAAVGMYASGALQKDFNIDEIRLGSAWDDVVSDGAPPEAPGQSLVYEGADNSGFTEGSAMNGSGSGNGWAGDWTGDVAWKAKSPGASYSGLPTTGLRMSAVNASNASVYRALDPAYTPLDGEVTYFSFIANNELVSYAGGNQVILSICNSATPTNNNHELFRVGHMFGGSKVKFRPNASGTMTTINSVDDGADDFIVVKVTWDLSSGGNEIVEIFHNPVLGSGEPQPTVTASANLREGNEVFASVKLTASGSLSKNASFDEFRFGNSWGDVTSGTNSAARWTNLHPGAGGQIQDVVCDPATPGKLYVLSDVEGLYRSEDWGLSYEYIAFDTHCGASYGLAVDHEVQGRIYLGTQRGVLISDDSGETWDAIVDTVEWLSDSGKKLGLPVANISVDPQDSDNVIFANSWLIKDSLYVWNDMRFNRAIDPNNSDTHHTGEIWYTRDRGATWDQSTFESTPGYMNIYTVVYNPVNSNQIFVAAHSGLYRGNWNNNNSTWNWQKLSAPSSTQVYHCRGVGLSPDGQWIYATWTVDSNPEWYGKNGGAAVPNNPACNVFVTKANSINWKNITNNLNVGISFGSAKFQTEYWNPVVDPVAFSQNSNQHRVIMGTLGGNEGLFHGYFNVSGSNPSFNENWQRLLSKSGNFGFAYDQGWDTYHIQSRIYELIPDSWFTGTRQQSELFASGGQNVFLSDSTDSGFPISVNSWSERYSEPVGFTAIGNHPLYRSRGWQSTINWDMEADDNYVIQAMSDNGLVESWDGGQSWTRDHRPASINNGQATFLVKDRSPKLILASGGSGFGAGGNTDIHAVELVNYSPADSWISGMSVGVGLPGARWDDIIATKPGSIHRVYVCNSGNDSAEWGIYEHTNLEQLIGSGNRGTFTKIFSQGKIDRIYPHPTNGNTIFALEPSQAIWKGTRNGSTWTWTEVFSQGGIRDCVVWEHNGTVRVAVSRDNGAEQTVHLSENGGDTFTEVLDDPIFWSLVPNPPYRDWLFTDDYPQFHLMGYKDQLFVFGGMRRNRNGNGIVRGDISSGSVTWEDWSGSGNDRHEFSMINKARVVDINGTPHAATASNGSGLWVAPVE